MGKSPWSQKEVSRAGLSYNKGAPGDDPLDPILQMPSPLVPRVESICRDFFKNKQGPFVKPNLSNQVKVASGGPAGGQTFEKFDKQVYKNEP